MTGEGPATPTRVMLVDDHPDFRDLMVTLLEGQPDLEVVAQAGTMAEARSRAATAEFDVVVLDLGLPDGNGADLIGDSVSLGRPRMTPQVFSDKWADNELKESAASKEHFLNLCALVDFPTPREADKQGEWFAFEKGDVERIHTLNRHRARS